MVNFFKVCIAIVLLICLFISNNLSAQLKSSISNNISLDSLYLQAKEFYEDGNYTSALPIYLQIDSIAEEKNILNDIVIKSILDRSEISRTTFTYEGVEMAKDLQLEALKKAEIINSDELVNNVYLRLADMYGLIDQLDSVKVYLDKAFEYYKQKDNVLKLNRAYLIYMNYYYSIDQLDSAGLFLKEGISYLSEKNYPQELAIINYYYASYLEKYRNEYSEALEQFNKTKYMFKELKDTTNRYYWYLIEGIAYTYAGLGDYKSAFEYYQESFDVKRRLDKKSDKDLTISLETKYQAEKKESEIQLLKAQTALAEKESRTQLIILIATIFLILIIAVFYFILSRNRKKLNSKLQELDHLKSNFFANISHEFRTPLTLIKGPAQMELNNPDLGGNLRKHLLIIDKNADNLLDLVDQLLDLSKLEANKVSLKVKPVVLKEWVNLQVEPLVYLAQQNHLNFRYKIDDDLGTVFIDPDVLQKVTTNLLSNAIKYTHENGEIFLGVSKQNGKLLISVKNSGEIIPAEQQEKIFDRFYQINGNKTGAGIGLALVKELAELHRGSVNLTTNENFNDFQVEVPCRSADYSATELELTETTDNESAKYSSSGKLRAQVKTHPLPIINNGKEIYLEEENMSIMLIVDDNAEIRALIREQFMADFRVEEAEDGASGVSKARDIIPDIIISDVMMPVLDGVQLVNTLKTDELTSHIPVVLLTAKAGEENEIAGLENGADDYLVKPVNLEKLKIRVSNLIASRVQLRNRYSQELILKPKDIAINTTDELFLKRVQELMDLKITNCDFTAELFSRDIGMSRMQLHRKLKALLGLSTSEFIKSQRLKMAAYLLSHSDINVSEVAYEVGFNDPSYFAKCFKAAYNTSPGNYARTHVPS